MLTWSLYKLAQAKKQICNSILKNVSFHIFSIRPNLVGILRTYQGLLARIYVMKVLPWARYIICKTQHRMKLQGPCSKIIKNFRWWQQTIKPSPGYFWTWSHVWLHRSHTQETIHTWSGWNPGFNLIDHKTGFDSKTIIYGGKNSLQIRYSKNQAPSANLFF